LCKLETDKVSMLDLRLIRSFVAVAETEHVGRAAARLHISQSPLSRQIRALESGLGLALFERLGRRVRLTAAGRWLLGEARDLLERAARLEGEAARVGAGTTGTLNVGYVSTAMWTGLLPGTLRRYRRRHPDVHLFLRNLTSRDQIDAILRGDLDIGIVHAVRGHPELAVATLREDRVVLAVADDHPLARRRRITPADLDGAPWIVLSGPSHAGGRDELIAACARAGFTPDVRTETGDRASVLGLVSAGFGLALVPGSAGRLPVQGLRLRELSFFHSASRLHLVRRASGAVPAAIELADELVAAGRVA
jgi:DNA-binding transcriptional LysR family regulator